MNGAIMSPEVVLKKLKRLLGINIMKLPIEDDYLMDIVYEDTIPTFSIYFPNYINYDIDPVLDKVADMEDTYFLDMEFFEANGISILGVNKRLESMERRKISDSMTYLGLGVEGLGRLQVESDMMSLFESGTITEFLPPNKVRISNTRRYTSNIQIELMVTHARNFRTIEPTKFEDFFKLALLDAKRSLWEELKGYENMDTAAGNIDLKISAWENAESDRLALLEKWDDLYIFDRKENMYSV